MATDQGGGGSVANKKLTSSFIRAPKPAPRSPVPRSPAPRSPAPRRPPNPTGGGSKPMFSPVARPNANLGDDIVKFFMGLFNKGVNTVGNAVTSFSDKHPAGPPPDVGKAWSDAGNAVQGGMEKANNFFSRFTR